MYDDLQIIDYPDPRLRKVSDPVTEFGEPLKALAERMFALMKEDKGVGLAAPQVGINRRLFVVSPTGEPQDAKVYANPVLSDAEGDELGEEGCLSLPDVRIDVPRATALRVRAQDVDGNPFEETLGGWPARIVQHENDHLNGRLILDFMGPTKKLLYRKKLKELQDAYDAAHPAEAAARAAAAAKTPARSRVRR